MISAGDFRNGVTLEIDGQVVQIMEFQHVKPGKGAAFVRTKLEKCNQRRRCRAHLPSHRKIPAGAGLTEWTCSTCTLTAICSTS